MEARPLKRGHSRLCSKWDSTWKSECRCLEEQKAGARRAYSKRLNHSERGFSRGIPRVSCATHSIQSIWLSARERLGTKLFLSLTRHAVDASLWSKPAWQRRRRIPTVHRGL